MKIALLNTPNQLLPIRCKGHLIEFWLHQFRGNLYCTTRIDGEYISGAVKVSVGMNLLSYPLWEKRYGQFIFRNKYDTAVTDYESYNDAVYLEYTDV